MRNSPVPKTALRGRSHSGHDQLARNLGYLSIALGMAELIAPDALCRAIGVKGLEPVVRAYGAREVANGVAILASHDPAPWIWARVAGDMADMATIATGLRQDNPKKNNNVLALAAVAAITAVDVVCANGLSSEKGGPKTALTDYSSRSGFPRGVGTARGAARDFRVPDDMRIPAALRPFDQAEARQAARSS